MEILIVVPPNWGDINQGEIVKYWIEQLVKDYPPLKEIPIKVVTPGTVRRAYGSST